MIVLIVGLIELMELGMGPSFRIGNVPIHDIRDSETVLSSHMYFLITYRGTTVGNVREVCTNIFDGSNQNASQNACNMKACPNFVEEWQYWARYWDGLNLGPVNETEELWKDGGGDLRLTCSGTRWYLMHF